ncbi:protein FAM151B [Folsomia candida]|uniref:protein FAM151B n=1 Tax=Folsomia candida TaxID=158441 RepID=UPI000B8FA2A6|nr:protein FAM151B [Folsomia candida]
MNYSIFLNIFSSLIYFSYGARDVEYPPQQFFPVDVSNVTWAHGVNSQEALTQTLADPSIRMIECDLSRGWLNISGVISGWEMVIMAHPPATTSDLSFNSFLDQVIEFNKGKSLEDMKGVKLDSKDYYSAAFSILRLRGRNESEPLKFPVWINADVVQGNSQSLPKVGGVDLLKLHNINLPSSVLSLGWTTKWDEGDIGKGYSREDMDEMIQVFRNFSSNPIRTENLPVTFAVRAVLAQNSLSNLLYLLNATSQRSSLTLWTGASDPKVDLALIADMFKVVGRHRVFVDLPYDDWKTSLGNGMQITNWVVLVVASISVCLRLSS